MARGWVACMGDVHGQGVGWHAWQGGMCDWVGMHGGGGHVWLGGMCGRGTCEAGDMATAADGMHPTEMHPCLKLFPIVIKYFLDIAIF